MHRHGSSSGPRMRVWRMVVSDLGWLCCECMEADNWMKGGRSNEFGWCK